jgi:hypothetical protein
VSIVLDARFRGHDGEVGGSQTLDAYQQGLRHLPVPDAVVAADQIANGLACDRLGAVDQLVTLNAALGDILGDIADLDPLGGKRR